MNSNRSSNQGPGKANGKNPPKKSRPKGISRAPRVTSRGPIQAASVAFGQVTKTLPAKISYRSDGSGCVISHCERFGVLVDTASTFVANSFPINPGMAATFPWLSAIAQRFESYLFRRLTFEYRTKCSTTTIGDIICVVDYDAADSAPISSVQAENYADTVSCVPWQTISQNCKASNLHKNKMFYVRTAALSDNQDIKTYDVGNFFACIEGTPNAGTNLGYLYVDYEVELMTPQLNSDAGSLVFGGEIFSGGAATAANPLGVSPTQDAQNIGLTVSAASVVTLAAAGTYVFTWNIIGTVVTAMTITNVLNTVVTTQVATLLNGAATLGTLCVIVVSSSDNATVQFGSTATTVTGGAVAIARGPPGSYT